jgi:hypothetical protein
MDELKKIAPELSKIKKENSFRAPDNYFDDFSARLQTRIEAEKRVLPEKENKIIRLLKPVIGLAASFAIVVMLVYWPIKKFMNNEIAANIDTETVILDDIYASMVEGIDEEAFYDLLETEEIVDDFSDEELFNYLSANVTDYEIYMEIED